MSDHKSFEGMIGERLAGILLLVCNLDIIVFAFDSLQYYSSSLHSKLGVCLPIHNFSLIPLVIFPYKTLSAISYHLNHILECLS